MHVLYVFVCVCMYLFVCMCMYLIILSLTRAPRLAEIGDWNSPENSDWENYKLETNLAKTCTILLHPRAIRLAAWPAYARNCGASVHLRDLDRLGPDWPLAKMLRKVYDRFAGDVAVIPRIRHVMLTEVLLSLLLWWWW